MEDCERLAEVEKILDEVADRANNGAVILVEGKRDRDSLRMLGIEGRIVQTSQEQLFVLAEKVATDHGDVIVLSDWDERGDEVAKKTEIYMRSNGVAPDCELRKKLKDLVKKDIKDVESLNGYIERLRETCSPKPQHY
jgi:5S rRNA maturation endonuclease (ribonuclease M5)